MPGTRPVIAHGRPAGRPRPGAEGRGLLGALRGQPEVAQVGRLEAELADAGQRLVEITRNLTPEGRSRQGNRAFLGYGHLQINKGLAALEPRVRRTVDSLHPKQSYRGVTLGYALNRDSDRRGVTLWSALPEAQIRASPLVPLQEQHFRAAPVSCPVMVLDDSCAIVPGAPHWSGEECAWATTDPETLRLSRRLVALTKAVAHRPAPSLAGGVSRRQLVVARLILLGAKNATIARRLGVSERTVGSDIADLSKGLGASGRGELVAVLGGSLGTTCTIDELL